MTTDLWRFAESLYQRPGVEAACLHLQDEGADVSRGTREAAGAHRLAVAQEDRAILRAAEIGKFQRGLRARDLVRHRLVGACDHRRGGAAGLGGAAVAKFGRASCRERVW